jgi:hypothetical protein
MKIRFAAVFTSTAFTGSVLATTALFAAVLATPTSHVFARALPTAAPMQDAAPDTRINGKWHFVFDTQGGDREFEADFTVAADGTVTGTWDKAPANGTYKDGHLLMAFDTTSEEAGETSTLHLDGKLDTDAITGNWAFSSYNGTFKATHPKP